jgi:hypothetical protein
MANRRIDDRAVWCKLLDPIREDYKVDSPGDLEILMRLVHDHQAQVLELAELSDTVQAQGKVLRHYGLVGH